jgi:chloramphenicol O-acetyltransferase
MGILSRNYGHFPSLKMRKKREKPLPLFHWGRRRGQEGCTIPETLGGPLPL